jgi:hypothetical protein
MAFSAVKVLLTGIECPISMEDVAWMPPANGKVAELSRVGAHVMLLLC